MYPLVLTLHSCLRWIVRASSASVAVVRFCTGLAGPAREWQPLDSRLATYFPMLIDIQLLLGLLLYFVLSPITTGALRELRRGDVERSACVSTRWSTSCS